MLKFVEFIIPWVRQLLSLWTGSVVKCFPLGQLKNQQKGSSLSQANKRFLFPQEMHVGEVK